MDHILATIAESDWLIYALSQSGSGTWLAELWCPQDDGSTLNTGSHYGFDTAAEALTAAFAGTTKAGRVGKYNLPREKAPEGSELLRQLGLAKPAQTIGRRI